MEAVVKDYRQLFFEQFSTLHTIVLLNGIDPSEPFVTDEYSALGMTVQKMDDREIRDVFQLEGNEQLPDVFLERARFLLEKRKGLLVSALLEQPFRILGRYGNGTLKLQMHCPPQYKQVAIYTDKTNLDAALLKLLDKIKNVIAEWDAL
jgi:hypothetical protein